MTGIGINMGLGLFLSSNFVRPAFNPLTDLASLVAWFDMQDPASYTQAGTVTSINNKKSGVAWTEGSVPPAYSASGFNSKPCMSFSGTQRIISTEAAVVAAMQGGTAYTLFVAGKVNTADAAMAFFGAGSSVNATNANRYFGNNTTASGVWIGAARSTAGVSVNYESAGTADTNNNILEWYSDAATGNIRKNGAAADPSAAAAVTGATAPDRCAIGCRPASTPNVLLNGLIGEIILCSAQLTATERNACRAYLGAKWGVTVS